MQIAPEKQSKQVDDQYVVHKSGDVYAVQSVSVDGETLTSRLVEVEHFNTDHVLGFSLPWRVVGVFKFVGLSNAGNAILRRKDITGKAMRCGELISWWKREWFASKIDE